ncbi:hypothetical protein GQ464_000615 [Rhodocaloribacter litoris]|uniref:hypothetical protein n=1 Tax=Rhodocaloribacter litoris TaxID=2558931 RepID=UPI001420ED05|nr:hypothetical protein [Rhodocaloribacter litoris]QXD15489.1 hypothetical protein GQ464_000615 [Rhodocaloribacter litoris]
MTADAKTHEGDLSWVQRIFDGDAEAWNQFVERFSDRVWRRAWQLCYETCPHKRGGVFCVFHALAAGGVQPSGDDRRSCDEGLEIYAFIFDYLYKRDQSTGKLKHYDGRARLDTFVSAVLHGHLRTDWIRHRRRLRVDQITLPPEIQRLPAKDQRVFKQMVMQRPTETIARKVGLSIEETEQAQERVTHALMTNGNLHLILRNPEGMLDDTGMQDRGDGPRLLPMQHAVDQIWEKVCLLISELPEHHKILLDMVFDKELDAKTILERCETLGVTLPVIPRSGNVTIHTVYQSVDSILKTVGERLRERFPEVLAEAYNWLDDTLDVRGSVSVKGLKALLKNMGLGPEPASRQAGPRASNAGSEP